jgi:hypothetical protein
MMEMFRELTSHETVQQSKAYSGEMARDLGSQRTELKLALNGLKIASPYCSMDLTAICEAKTTLKGKSRSVQLSLGSYPHLH